MPRTPSDSKKIDDLLEEVRQLREEVRRRNFIQLVPIPYPSVPYMQPTFPPWHPYQHPVIWGTTSAGATLQLGRGSDNAS